ncbi:MAG: hypothetical protein PHR47_04135 [Candidatus Pacebacteria bacterium]|nr:hypothetical protein [Candidatus Paceibacterota bacterium]
MNYKKIFATIIFFSSLLFLYDVVFAYTIGSYPAIGETTPDSDASFFVYAYNVCIAGGVFIAAVSLIAQGVKIITAGENAGKVAEAKERFGSIALGLGVLLSSYVMLAAINPALLEIKLPNFPDLNLTGSYDSNLNSGDSVSYVEVPIGAQIESILNAVSTANSQAYNYSSLDVEDKSGEERCYLYDEYGNARDKNGDGYITELDEYQGLDFSVCINELLKAMEHKILYLNGGKYRCGTAGYTDDDSPKAIGDMGNPRTHDGISGYSGKTTLGINYHDFDIPKTDTCRWSQKGDDQKCSSVVEASNCNEDGTEGIINKLKKYIRDGCTCNNCGYCCRPDCICCGETRGRDNCCQGDYNNIYDEYNPYKVLDPCKTRRSIDCMRKFINYIVYGDIEIDYEQRQLGCNPQEAAVSYPTSGVSDPPSNPTSKPIVFNCDDFSESDDPEVKGSAETTSLTAGRERLVSFRTYYEKRLEELEATERFLMSDKRLEIYSRAEMQKLQQEATEKYSFSQDSLSFPYKYDTTTYRRKFNCSAYDNSVNLNKKNVYEDDADRIQDFTADWGESGIDAMYKDAQKNNRKVRIRTGEMISNLHVDKSMKIEGSTYNGLTADERDSSLCSRGDLATLAGENIHFFDIDETCTGGGSGEIVARSVTPSISKKRAVAWNDDLYAKGGFSYSVGDEEFYTGEEMATNGDPLTFYVLEDPKTKVDPFYTGRDQMPYYFQKGFIDYTQYAENTAIDTEIIKQRGNILPSLIPIGQLSYHTKIYAKQMIRNINRTIEQIDVAIDSLSKIANTYVESGCTCTRCTSKSCQTINGCHTCDGTCGGADNKCQGPGYCNKLQRYEFFKAGDFTPENEEIFAENIIYDKWPAMHKGTVKMIVKNRACAACKKYSDKQIIYPFSRAVNYRYEKVQVGEVEDFLWDGEESIILHSLSEDGEDIPLHADDILTVINLTNGKSKEWGTNQYTYTGRPNITSILEEGSNHLQFWLSDLWADWISITSVMLRTCGEYDYTCGKTGAKRYHPPEGFTLLECNAWDSDLKEERPCVDYKGDIVVTLRNDIRCGKPVIYLYPENTIEANVKISFDGKFTETIPEYNKSNGWNVIASPNGKLINKEDNKKYNYLFWEGDANIDFDLSKGFVIEGGKTKEFLEQKLKEIGLNKKEYDEFIEYWEPRMKSNKYNLIHFSDQEYNNAVEMNITPKPDSILRVFMAYQPLEEFRFVISQEFEKFERKGFTVVEWGGGVVDKNKISFGRNK